MVVVNRGPGGARTLPPGSRAMTLLPRPQKTLSIALAAAAVLLPIQLFVGDSMATYMTACTSRTS